MFTEEVPGLGLTVTMTTRFDPQRIRERLTYWLETVVNIMAVDARKQINESKIYYPDENERGRRGARRKAIDKGMADKSWVVRDSSPSTKISIKKQIMSFGIMAVKAVAGYVIPGIGWALALYSLVGMFSKPKKKPYLMPWDDIYSAALPHAKAETNKEELARIEAEGVRIEKEVQTEITKTSEAAAMFKLPEGVTSISRGALVMSPVAIKQLEPESVKVISVNKPVIKTTSYVAPRTAGILRNKTV